MASGLVGVGRRCHRFLMLRDAQKSQASTDDRQTMVFVNEQRTTERRFGPEFVAQHRRNMGKYPPEQRQLTYEIAVNDEYEPWRQWLDDQLALLPGSTADVMAHRIWLDEHFWPVNFELAAGAGLRAAGLRVAYEQDWDGVTPDWTVLLKNGKPLAFVEVHTDQPPQGTFGQMRAWHGLVERLKAIPVPVVLQLASGGGPVSPPDAGTAKRIAKDLKIKLLQQPWANMFLSHGYRFLVMGDPRRGGQQMVSPLGMHACFDPPSSRAGPVSAHRLMDRVEEKVRSYRDLAEAYEVPLVVAVGAHRLTGVTLQHIDDMLTGLPSPKITFQFNAGDPHIGEQTVSLVPVPPWPWPEDLAGLLWMDNELPFKFAARPNPNARRRMLQALIHLAPSRS